MASGIEIDLATTILPTDHRVWKLFPGEAYKFLKLIDGSKLAFLDVRNLDRLSKNPKDWSKFELTRQISIDRWTRQNAQRDQKTDRRVSPGDRQTATLVEGLLLKAQKGDLLAVPSPGADGLVSIYQITSAPGVVKSIEAQDGRTFNTYIGRPIRWVGSLRKRALDYGVSELLHTPVAFFDMGDAGRTQIYEEVFGNYIYKGSNIATYRVAKQDYNSRDNRIVSTWIEFIDLVTNDREFKKAIQGSDGFSIYELLDNAKLDDDDRSDLSININSPGEIIMKAISMSPLVGLALFPMAANGVSYKQASAAEVHLTAVGSASNDCKAQIDESVRSIVKALGADRWQRACDLASRAQRESELSTDASIE